MSNQLKLKELADLLEIEIPDLVGEKGPKGEKGEKGESGKDGIDGRDGKDGIDGRDGKDGIDGRDGKDGIDGKEGIQGSPDTPQEIRDKLESLKDDERLDISSIKGLEEFIKKFKQEKSVFLGGGLNQVLSFFENEIPAGTINGVNKIFTLNHAPRVGTTRVYLNGLRQLEGVGDDYTLSGATITFVVAPATNSNLLADYRV